MFDFRKIALWLAIILVPGGVFLLLLPLLSHLRRGRKKLPKGDNATPEADAQTSRDDSGPSPRTPDDGPSPRIAA